MTKTKSAKERAKRVRNPRPNCPWPEKIGFADREEAVALAFRRALKTGKAIRAYHDCPCGQSHLTSRPSRIASFATV